MSVTSAGRQVGFTTKRRNEAIRQSEPVNKCNGSVSAPISTYERRKLDLDTTLARSSSHDWLAEGSSFSAGCQALTSPGISGLTASWQRRSRLEVKPEIPGDVST